MSAFTSFIASKSIMISNLLIVVLMPTHFALTLKNLKCLEVQLLAACATNRLMKTPDLRTHFSTSSLYFLHNHDGHFFMYDPTRRPVTCNLFLPYRHHAPGNHPQQSYTGGNYDPKPQWTSPHPQTSPVSTVEFSSVFVVICSVVFRSNLSLYCRT